MNAVEIIALVLGLTGAVGAVGTFVYHYSRRPVRNTLTMTSTAGLGRGMLLQLDTGQDDALIVVRRIVSNTTVATVPYSGWRRLAMQTRARWRRRYRALEDRVYGWFEKGDEDDG